MFRLRIEPAKLPKYARHYDYASDEDALAAGAQIALGRPSRRALETIFRWKVKGRGISRLQKNSDLEICDALTLASRAKTERSALSVLLGLNGVAIPVASAVLTAINPAKYTIIDFRALWSLSVATPPAYRANYYLEYLQFCRLEAPKARLSLRDFDRALWKYSEVHQPAGGRG